MFQNRIEAGRLLGQRLTGFAAEHPVILALPRGGVPVAAEVARMLNAPLDVILVRKLGVPFHPEYAMGAIGEGDVRFIDWRVVSDAGVTATQLERVIERVRLELGRRAHRFRRPGRPRLDVSGRLVIVVDDGIATGVTGAAKNTITKLLVDLGHACADYQDKVLRDLRLTTIQCDEIWALCYSKQKNVPVEHQGTFGYGDVWTWVAIDSDIKARPHLAGRRAHPGRRL